MSYSIKQVSAATVQAYRDSVSNIRDNVKIVGDKTR